MKKRTALLILVLLTAILLSGCRSVNRLNGIYTAEDGKTTLVFDEVLYVLEEDEVFILPYRYNPVDDQLTVGTESVDFFRSEDGESLRFGGEAFVKTRGSPSLSWRLVKAAAKQYIAARGVIRWILLPFSSSGLRTVGTYGIGGAVAADIAIVLLTVIIGSTGSTIGDTHRSRR